MLNTKGIRIKSKFNFITFRFCKQQDFIKKKKKNFIDDHVDVNCVCEG